jgi:hypothetical protein
MLLCSQTASAQVISWLTDCSEKTFCLNAGSCTQGNVFMVEKAVTNCLNPNINYTYKIDLNNDGGLEIQSSEDTVKGNFAKGTHKIIWRASDNCGNAVQCTYLFHVKDCFPPNLLCINGLTQSLDPPNCEISFNVNQFILNLSDNCIPAAQIERGIRIAGTGMGFPETDTVSFGICDNGLNLLEVWVRDNNGLTNQCANYVLVQSSDDACDCNADSDLAFNGCVRAANNVRLSNYRSITSVKSLAGVAQPVNKLKVTPVSDSCFVNLQNQIPFGGDYQVVVRADKPDAPLNGVTTFDLVLMSKHILGIEAFTSAYQMEAADVNNSNSVTTFDIVEIRKLILGINDSFALVPAWRFVKPLPNPANLGSFTALQDTYQLVLPNLQVDTAFSGFQFVGVKYGDVNYTAALGGEADDRSVAKPLYLEIDDQDVEAGETIDLPIRLGPTYHLDGWQIALDADPEALELESLSGMDTMYYRLSKHQLRAINHSGFGKLYRDEKNETILVLRVKVLKDTRLSKVLWLNAQKLQPEAYVPGAKNETLRHPIELRFNARSLDAVQYFSVSPNPFVDEVHFYMYLQNAGTAYLELFNLSGQQVFSESYELAEGNQRVHLSRQSLPRDKVLLYRFWANGMEFSGKLLQQD